VIREMKHPQFRVDAHDDGVAIRLWIPGSKFGPVEAILAPDKARELAEAIEQASATEPA
jgi:hypothetical protein